MFGFGRSRKIKRVADEFVEATIEEADKLFRSYLQIIMQSLTDNNVEPKRVAEVINATSPSVVFFAALFSYELIIVAHAYDGKLKHKIFGESLKSLKRNLHGQTGKAIQICVDQILENITFQNSITPCSEKINLKNVGWNSLKFFDFQANPEIQKLMDSPMHIEKLTKFLDDTSVSWWKTAESNGAF